jgi:hypothetical protein
MEDLAGLRVAAGCGNVAAPRGVAIVAEEATIDLNPNRPELSEARNERGQPVGWPLLRMDLIGPNPNSEIPGIEGRWASTSPRVVVDRPDGGKIAPELVWALQALTKLDPCARTAVLELLKSILNIRLEGAPRPSSNA